MGRHVRLGHLLALVAAAATFGCGGDGLPTSPTQLPTPNATTPNLAADLLGGGVLGVGSSAAGPSDYHEPPMPTPGPAPAPDPNPAPGPATMAISIVGSAGAGAFAPNPLHAAVGNILIWTNNDATVHRIVLDDGTAIGTIAPGQSSTPVAMSAAAVTYRCTFHPSMVGTIHDPSAPAPAPTPAPLPPPDYYEPPPDDGYGGYY